MSTRAKLRRGAGALRDTVTIEKNTGTSRGSMGSNVPSWVTHGTRRCALRTLTGREAFIGDTLQARVDHEIEFRYLAGVTPAMRAVVGTRTFDIHSINNVENRNKVLILIVEEVAA